MRAKEGWGKWGKVIKGLARKTQANTGWRRPLNIRAWYIRPKEAKEGQIRSEKARESQGREDKARKVWKRLRKAWEGQKRPKNARAGRERSKKARARPTLCLPYCNTLRWLVGRLQMMAFDLILNFMVSGLMITHYWATRGLSQHIRLHSIFLYF